MAATHPLFAQTACDWVAISDLTFLDEYRAWLDPLRAAGAHFITKAGGPPADLAPRMDESWDAHALVRGTLALDEFPARATWTLSVVYELAVPLAVWLGADEVALYGCDRDYGPAGQPAHFYEDAEAWRRDEREAWFMAGPWRAIVGAVHGLAERELAERGVRMVSR
jgi:hypothetical protein